MILSNGVIAVLITTLICLSTFLVWYKKKQKTKILPKTPPKKSYRRKPWFTKETEETKVHRASMEGTSLVVPPALIPVQLILDGKNWAKTTFCDEFKKRGYACIKVEPFLQEISSRLTREAFQYFDQDTDIKIKNRDPKEGNVGYIHIPGVREYIKLHPNDPDQLWPNHPQDFKSAFTDFHKSYSKIALSCFSILSEWIDVEEPEGGRFILEEDEKIIKCVLEERSSVSMIKYYVLEENKEVCDEHTDTGILTFITRTQRPSLEVWDRSEKKYVKIEELLDIGDIVVLVGEKVPLFSCSMRFRPTFHRVRMSAGPERLSIAYLLDVVL